MSSELSHCASAHYDSCAVSGDSLYRPLFSSQSLVVALERRVDWTTCQLDPASPVGSNAAARLIFEIRRSEHITDALASLHWLRIPERILFKVAVLTSELQCICVSAVVLLYPRRILQSHYGRQAGLDPQFLLPICGTTASLHASPQHRR